MIRRLNQPSNLHTDHPQRVAHQRIFALVHDSVQPRRPIEVTDDGSTHGPAFFQRRHFGQWTGIGQLVFTEAVASYNGDFVIHFNHPTWRDDRNDPSTATRVNERAFAALLQKQL